MPACLQRLLSVVAAFSKRRLGIFRLGFSGFVSALSLHGISGPFSLNPVTLNPGYSEFGSVGFGAMDPKLPYGRPVFGLGMGATLRYHLANLGHSAVLRAWKSQGLVQGSFAYFFGLAFASGSPVEAACRFRLYRVCLQTSQVLQASSTKLAASCDW